MSRQGLAGCLIFVLLWLPVGGMAQAQATTPAAAMTSAQPLDFLKGISDPTRPPPGVMLRKDGASGAVGPQAASLPASGASAPDGQVAVVKPKPRPVELRLQAIRYMADTGYAVAMINDELVEVGGKVAGMRVVSISRLVAVLKGSAGVRRLMLQPDAEEQYPQPDPGVTDDAAESGRKESQ